MCFGGGYLLYRWWIKRSKSEGGFIDAGDLFPIFPGVSRLGKSNQKKGESFEDLDNEFSFLSLSSLLCFKND